MAKALDEVVADLEKRVNRIENIAWVLAAVAVFLGIGGGSLWSSLGSATEKAAEAESKLEQVSKTIERDVAASVTLGIKEIDAHASKILDEISQLQKAHPGWSVAYCIHQESYGWGSWVTDGAQAGRSGISKRLEAVRVVLYRKDREPPEGNCAPG